MFFIVDYFTKVEHKINNNINMKFYLKSTVSGMLYISVSFEHRKI